MHVNTRTRSIADRKDVGLNFWVPHPRVKTWYFREDVGSLFDEDHVHNTHPERTEALCWLQATLTGHWSWIRTNHVEFDGDITVHSINDSRVYICTRLLSRSDALLYRLSRPVSLIDKPMDIDRYYV